MNLGSGRVVYQDFTRINKSIEEGDFGDNPALVHVTETVKQTNGALHVMGLLSPGGVHSHEEQIFSLIKVAAAKGVGKIYLHAVLRRQRHTATQRQGLTSKSGRAICRAAMRTGDQREWSLLCYGQRPQLGPIERAYNLVGRGEAPFHATTGVKALEKALPAR